MKSLKIRLELNNKQITLANKHAGVARYIYNWGKSICDSAIQNKEHRPSSIDLHKLFVKNEKSIKPENLFFKKLTISSLVGSVFLDKMFYL